eukprot:NP_510677.1 Uncharacterized protein CELE_T25D1.3 [Caenorhabditis elegans]
MGFTTKGLATMGLTTKGLTTKGLTTKGLTTKGLTTKGLTTKGLTTKGLTTKGLATMGLTTKGLTTKGNTTRGFFIYSALFRLVSADFIDFFSSAQFMTAPSVQLGNWMTGKQRLISETMNLENLPSVVHRKLFKMFDACDLFFLSITFGNIKETIQKMNLDISDIAMDMTAKRKLFLLKIQCSSTGRQYLSFTTKIPNGTKRQKPVYLKIGDLTLKCRSTPTPEHKPKPKPKPEPKY